MKKVLVVDDTKNIRNMLKACLEIEGYDVAAVDNGPEALDSIGREHYNLIFLDIKLPGISGTEVLRRIREMGITVPVIIMTAFATVKNAVKCTRLGAVAYLQKPFTAEKVRHTLSEIKIKEDNNTGAADIGLILDKCRALIDRREFEAAFTELKQALTINPDCGQIYDLLVRLYQEQGNEKESELFAAIARKFGK